MGGFWLGFAGGGLVMAGVLLTWWHVRGKARRRWMDRMFGR